VKLQNRNSTFRPYSDERTEEIASLAETVREDYSITGPFEPKSILRELGITICYGHYDAAFDGMLELRRDRFHIYCNLDRLEGAGTPRSRFTIGHELGHYFIDEHRNALLRGLVPPHASKCEFESDLLVEREADNFASHLLMPRLEFSALASRQKPGLPGILGIAEHFKSSITSAAIRYVQLETVPCVVVKWSDGRFQWRWASTEFFQSRLLGVERNIQRLPDDCPTRKALANEKPPSKAFFEAGSTIAAWFPTIRETDYRNSILIEQAIQLGRFGVLTFLFPESLDI
jgi:hypothetical protein